MGGLGGVGGVGGFVFPLRGPLYPQEVPDEAFRHTPACATPDRGIAATVSEAASKKRKTRCGGVEAGASVASEYVGLRGLMAMVSTGRTSIKGSLGKGFPMPPLRYSCADRGAKRAGCLLPVSRRVRSFAASWSKCPRE
jgi:hypothetical protein